MDAALRRKSSRKPVVPLAPHDESRTPRKFLESQRAPFAIRWYGATSLYGHFRNFISRAIAAEQVDSRDWMRPQPPEVLLDRISDVLGAKHRGKSLLERLGHPLWIDFVADSGDDRDTSEAVAEMLAQRYSVRLPDGTERELPRGEILLFGGDTAYPVSTAEELHRRLTQPWNTVFRQARSALGERKRRVLMGVPGNHDWYDGLDGFGRLFRRSATSLPELGSSRKPTRRSRSKILARLRKLGSPLLDSELQGKVGELGHKLHLDEVSGTLRIFGSVYRSIRAILAGGSKRRRKRLVLLGYTAVQEASYFALPLAPGIDLWGVDRQLGRLDFRQRTYFRKLRSLAPHRSLVVCASDPFSAYGEPNNPGVQILEAVGLDTKKDRFLYLTGDYHHYERREIDRAVQVIGGGGGAFLHGTRINQFSASRLAQGNAREIPRPAATYPSAAVSRRLLSGVPFKLVTGRAGYLVHLAGALVAWLELASAQVGALSHGATVGGVVLCTIGLLYFIAGHGSAHPRFILAVAVPFGVLLGVLPALLRVAIGDFIPPAFWWVLIVLAAFLLTLVFGVFLTANAVLGLEHQQAFTVLGHTGFKHFVRSCIHPDGRVESYAIGKDDPLAKQPATLLDRFVTELSAPEPAEEEPPASSRAPERLEPVSLP